MNTRINHLDGRPIYLQSVPKFAGKSPLNWPPHSPDNWPPDLSLFIWWENAGCWEVKQLQTAFYYRFHHQDVGVTFNRNEGSVYNGNKGVSLLRNLQVTPENWTATEALSANWYKRQAFSPLDCPLPEPGLPSLRFTHDIVFSTGKIIG